MYLNALSRSNYKVSMSGKPLSITQDDQFDSPKLGMKLQMRMGKTSQTLQREGNQIAHFCKTPYWGQ